MDHKQDANQVIQLVRNVIEQRTNGSIHNLEVSVSGDSIVLCGRTTRYYYKQLATSAVLDELSTLSFEVKNGIHVG